jgi:translation initiation factor 3 subunit D
MPSVDVQGTWDLVEEFDLSKLSKLAANPPKTTDLCWCGYVDEYDDSYDKITTRTAKVLRRFENKRFFSVPTTEDPIIDKYVLESEGNVFATDSVLAQLMAAPRSVYSWDIVIEKTNGMLFLSKRDNSTFDLLTVSETAYEPPVASDEIDEMNHPHKLSLEASMINQNFSQQILKDLRDDADNTIRKKVDMSFRNEHLVSIHTNMDFCSSSPTHFSRKKRLVV